MIPNKDAGEYAISKSNELEKLVITKDPLSLGLIRIIFFSKFYNEYIINNNLNCELLKL